MALPFGRKINEQYHLENALTFMHKCLHDYFNKQILKNFLIKIVIQRNSYVKFDAFSRRNGAFIFPRKRSEAKVLFMFYINQYPARNKNYGKYE